MEVKRKIQEIKENAEDLDLSDFFCYFVICFGIGIVIFYCEAKGIIPLMDLWLPCFIVGMVFLTPWLLFN